MDTELGDLSAKVYDPRGQREVNDNWEIIDDSRWALAARNKRTGNIAVAFRGTKAKGDFLTDIALTSGYFSLTPRYRKANRYVSDIRKQNPDSEIILTGHSLGGFTAAEVAKNQGLKSVSFNAPAPLLRIQPDMSKEHTFYRTKRDPIGTSGLLNFGRQRRWETGSGHAAKNFLIR